MENERKRDSGGRRRSWVDYLGDEDLSFIKRFILGSGSLKELASQYGVSYPTVRRRLDRLIAKLEVIDDRVQATEFERILRAAHADGRIDEATTAALLAAYREEREESS